MNFQFFSRYKSCVGVIEMKRSNKGAVMKHYLSLILVCFVLLPLAGCITKYVGDNGTLYTTHNIWVENPEKVYAINYKRGMIIPAGTRVDNIVYKRNGDYPYVRFTPEGFKGTVSLLMVKRYQPGLSIQELAQRTFSHKNFGELTEGLSEDEITMIKRGRVKVGMSRRAVVLSYGFPPLHETLYYEKNTKWKYWMSRVKTKLIIFDNDWTVLQIFD